MISQGGRSVTRLGAQRFGSRTTVVTFSTIERKCALNTLQSSSNDAKSVFRLQNRSLSLSRSYADKPVSRPKAHTGRTSATQKRAPTTSATKAAKKPPPETTAPKRIPKAKSKAEPSLKPKPKPKPKPRKKAKAKPKPKRKILTDKEKTARTEKQQREKAKDLREKALLGAPKATRQKAWNAFLSERIKPQLRSKHGVEARTVFSNVSKESSAQYKAITPEQLEHYNHIANQATATNEAAYLQWVRSYSPQQVRDANDARRALIRLYGQKSASKFRRIKDERLVRRPWNSYIFFMQSRFDSGDFKGLRSPEAIKLAAREWKALSAAEKKPFEDSAAQDQQRYLQENKTVYDK